MKIINVAKDIKSKLDLRGPKRIGGTTISIIGESETGKSFVAKCVAEYLKKKYDIGMEERCQLTPQLKINPEKVTIFSLQEQDDIYDTNCQFKYMVHGEKLSSSDRTKIKTIFK